MPRSGSIVALPDAELIGFSVEYPPTTPADWPEGEPADTDEALDTLAARSTGSGGSDLSTVITNLIAHQEFGGM